jgi:hypothetical protein
MRAAAEALEALERGETPEVLPPGGVINPTPKQIAQLAKELRPFGIKLPGKIPTGGWSSPIFAMATHPPKKRSSSASKQFTDLSKESAIIGSLTGEGLFNQIPAGKLPPVEAFTDELCRILYGAARAVLARGSAVCLESVNDELAATGKYKQLARLMDPSGRLSADLWKQWPERVDLSLSACFSPRPVV